MLTKWPGEQRSKEPNFDFDESFTNMAEKVNPAKMIRRTNQDMDIESEPECCLAYIEDLNTVKHRMTTLQERVLLQEKLKEEAQDLRSLHANDSASFSMESEHKHMEHSKDFKVHFNVY